MLINPRHEIVVFISAFLCGQIVCIIFDAFRALRKNFNPSVYTVNIHDIIFCSVSFILVYRTFSYTNYGSIRWYEICALGVSSLIYFFFESKYILKFFTFIFSLIIKPLNYIIRKLFRIVNIVKKSIFKQYIAIYRHFSEYYIKKPPKRSKK